LTGSLDWAEESIVAVDTGRNTRPYILAIVAILDKALASGKGVVHRLAFALIQNSRVSAIAASHGPVVFVLSQTITQTIANKDGLQIDVSFFVRHNLRCKNRNIMSSIRFPCNVEVLFGILWELLKEESQKSVDIFSGSDCIADGAPTI
jgi:hypothetical protein